MAIRTIIHAIDQSDTLHTPCEAILPEDISSDEIQTLIDDMIETMNSANGIGIAAIQINVLKRVLIAQLSSGTTVLINPKIISPSEAMIVGEEGCLSIPGVFGTVERHKKIRVKALDRHGDPVRLSLTGMDAVVVQHEVDHLDGVLFTDPERLIEYTRTTPEWNTYLGV